MMLTPVKQPEIDHTIYVYGKKFAVGTTQKGQFFDPPSTYFCTVEMAGETDAVVKIISHTKGSQFKTGERVRFVFKSKT